MNFLNFTTILFYEKCLSRIFSLLSLLPELIKIGHPPPNISKKKNSSNKKFNKMNGRVDIFWRILEKNAKSEN